MYKLFLPPLRAELQKFKKLRSDFTTSLCLIYVHINCKNKASTLSSPLELNNAFVHQVGQSDSVSLQLQTCDFIAQIFKSLHGKRGGPLIPYPF